MSCPCCAGERVEALEVPGRHERCEACGHRWRAPGESNLPAYYRDLENRNPAADPQKLDERLRAIAPWLVPGQRVLEVGCAEGALGERAKALAELDYTGLEPSRDALSAAKVLDRVECGTAASLEGTYDVVLAFHVLEHIPDAAGELRHWRRLLAAEGALVVEVPNGAGHPLLAYDANAEHVHQFTPASLATLLGRGGFELLQLTSGHFESAVYPDSLRAIARHRLGEDERRARLLARFRARLPQPFAVYGVGGDFRNYVLPVLAELPVAALIDSDGARHGEHIGGHVVCGLDPERHGGLSVLIASLRHHDAIAALLVRAGFPKDALVGLAEIFGPGR